MPPCILLFIYLTLKFKIFHCGGRRTDGGRTRVDKGAAGGWGEWRPPCCRFCREVNQNQTNDRRTIGVEGGE